MCNNTAIACHVKKSVGGYRHHGLGAALLIVMLLLHVLLLLLLLLFQPRCVHR